MDSPDWLRTQLTSFNCPACGRRYGASRIRLLAEREGLFFVDLDCSRCGSHTVAIVTVELDEAELSIADASDIGLPAGPPGSEFGEPRRDAGEPVTADDVLEMHEFLAGFAGDMQALLAGSARRRDGAERR